MVTTDTLIIIGDYSAYADPSAVRTKKAVDRGIGGNDRPMNSTPNRSDYYPHQPPPNTGLSFEPPHQPPRNAGLSFGGLMETRIGEVGTGSGRMPTVPEASAHMY